MARTPEATREKILDAAHDQILRHGYAGTSIDMVLAQTGLTKGAFFHHFKSKAELAHALIARFAEKDLQLMSDSFTRVEKLTRDPLQQVLLLVGLFQEMFEGLAEPYACLFASYVYQNDLLTEETKAISAHAMLAWRKMLGQKLREVAAKYPPRLEVDPNSLADLWNSVLEGAFVMSKTLNDPALTVAQILHYRQYLELLFSPDIGTAHS